ncbi:mediator of RNA polymerase II transcription subunit 28 [Lepeophtheirus salmonis]|nr:mediator of RNA polymerase II transcription subunit 28-like [Lepeophtheirus salmonis]
MANSGNTPDNPQLLVEFEEAYRDTVASLTHEDLLCDRSQDVMIQELEEKITKFAEIARKLDTFFVQKRFLLYSHKPESILREESTDLRQELAKKDEILRKHYERLGQWQALLQDTITHEDSQQAKSHHHQMQPHHPQIRPHHPVMPGAPLQPGLGAPQGGFVPGNNYRMQQQPHGGPLAYLERTTTNIGSR